MFSIQQYEAGGFPPPSNEELRLTRKELGALFDLSVSTIKRLETQGVISPIVVNCRTLFYGREHIEALQRAHYRLIQEEALRLGLRLVSPAVTPNSPAPKPQLKEQFQANGSPPEPSLGADLAAHTLVANLRWLLSRPEIRREIANIARETDFDRD